MVGGGAAAVAHDQDASCSSVERHLILALPPRFLGCSTDEPQVYFGEAIDVIGGVRQKMHVFYMDLPHSDTPFMKTYPAETTEALLDGHVSAFAFPGGVPRSILYDNTKQAVAEILRRRYA